ncbi:MAG TPA: FG-GAP-like repeat-containing protein [Steroidobacteraceae bacterium]
MTRQTGASTVFRPSGFDTGPGHRSARTRSLPRVFSTLCLLSLCTAVGGSTPSYTLIVGSRVYLGALQGSPQNTYQVQDVLVGDLNDDGAPDVVIGNGFAPPVVFFNNRTANPFQDVPGSFIAPPPSLSTSFNAQFGAAALADVNADGHPDIVISAFNVFSGSTPNMVYLNDGSFTPFNNVNGVPIGTQDAAPALALGDVNGDGFVDLAVVNTNHVPSRLYLTQGAPLTSGSYSTVEIGTDLGYGTDIKIADVNGDGKPDLILAYMAAAPSDPTGIAIYFNNATSDPFNNVKPVRLLAGQAVWAIAVADLNNDGKTDLVASASGGNFTKALYVYSNTGSSSLPFGDPQALQPDNDLGLEGCLGVSVGDMNGDTLPDLAFSCDAPNAQVSPVVPATPAVGAIYVNNGTANPFANVAPVDIPATKETSGFARSIAVGKLVKNGAPDVLLTVDGEPGLASYSPLTLDQDPVAQDDSAVTAVNKSTQINVVANDSAGPGRSLNAGSLTITKAPVSGAANANTDGSITYTPSPGYSGSDGFQYTVRDGLGAPSNVASVSIRVQPAPVAVNDTARLQANQSVTIDVLANDTTAGGTIDPASIKIVAEPMHGTTHVADGEVIYTPTIGYSGLDTVQYSVQDNLGTASNVAAVAIEVTAVAPPSSEGGNSGGGGNGNGGHGGGGALGLLDLFAFASFALIRLGWQTAGK